METVTTTSNGTNRKQFAKNGRGGDKKRRKVQKAKKPVGDGSAEEVLLIDVKNLLLRALDEEGAEKLAEKEMILPEKYSTIELTIHELGSNGDGLAYSPNRDRIYVVPFTLPGDVVEAKIYAHLEDHSLTDLLKVVTPSASRDDSLIGCKYFGNCGGCQFQMLSYAQQLIHKRRVVEKAYENFSSLDPAVVPEIGPTWGSPLQYNYRTKLTPHFDGPRKGGWPVGAEPPSIGFQKKGQRYVIDIEDCPIGTPALREGLVRQRKWTRENIHTYKRGATLLLRESTIRTPKEGGAEGEYAEEKVCVTDNKETITEYIGQFKFISPAGTFFQNNNSILNEFTTFVRENLHLPIPNANETTPKYLVDAYCGSGLFTITCGNAFDKVIGVDVSPEGIAFASKNAELNNIRNASFLEGNAEKIFEKVDFPGSETSVIIDPPRKGSDKAFLDQLLDLTPRRIVYISCNVHTQARDLGYFLTHEKGVGYRIDSIRGFDFFPQTHHVESVAVLTKVI
ncbi:S-adenosyl-L-methionine-dependent methyltransferase [Tirmania nivea]|nr:S-adenosyl-L-methionine-dependent methyltransferase [Tirmania nivea]